MKIFDSPGKFAKHLMTVLATEVASIHIGLEKVGKVVEKTAKSEFGIYQPEVGPFNEWDDLAYFTIEDRIRQGYTPNDPLLRSGELRDSISHHVDTQKGSVTIGSTSEIMPYQEFGTVTIPPRPVLGPAAFRNKKKIKMILGEAAVMGLIGGQRIHKALGYDTDTKGE